MNRVHTALLITLITVPLCFAEDARIEQNKAIARRVFTDILSAGKFEKAGEIYAPDFVNHQAIRDVAFAEDQASSRGWRAAFPDLEMIIEKEIAEKDMVVIFWRARGTNTGVGNGLNATGKKAEGRGISIFRVVDGKIKDEWTEFSQLLVLQQLGLAGKK